MSKTIVRQESFCQACRNRLSTRALTDSFVVPVLSFKNARSGCCNAGVVSMFSVVDEDKAFDAESYTVTGPHPRDRQPSIMDVLPATPEEAMKAMAAFREAFPEVAAALDKMAMGKAPASARKRPFTKAKAKPAAKPAPTTETP